MSNINEEILDKLTKVCVCNAISRYSIKKAIENGATTVDEIKKVTGACTGSCKGSRCRGKIEELIKQYDNREV